MLNKDYFITNNWLLQASMNRLQRIGGPCLPQPCPKSPAGLPAGSDEGQVRKAGGKPCTSPLRDPESPVSSDQERVLREGCASDKLWSQGFLTQPAKS